MLRPSGKNASAYRSAICRLRGVVLVILAVAILPAAAIDPASLVQGLDRVRLTISTSSGESVEIGAFVARTAAQRAQGLMNVRAMAADEGMLFIYQRPAVISMWMKNTFIPLDMLFADSRGNIVHMHAGAVPHDTSIISSIQPASLVLELNAGSIEAFGIATGDRITLQTE